MRTIYSLYLFISSAHVLGVSFTLWLSAFHHWVCFCLCACFSNFFFISSLLSPWSAWLYMSKSIGYNDWMELVVSMGKRLSVLNWIALVCLYERVSAKVVVFGVECYWLAYISPTRLVTWQRQIKMQPKRIFMFILFLFLLLLQLRAAFIQVTHTNTRTQTVKS